MKRLKYNFIILYSACELVVNRHISILEIRIRIRLWNVSLVRNSYLFTFYLAHVRIGVKLPVAVLVWLRFIVITLNLISENIS